MKKHITVIILTAILVVISVSCNETPYAVKTVHFVNDSDVDITAVHYVYGDNIDSIDSRISISTEPVIYAGDTKDYAVPYMANQGTSDTYGFTAYYEEPDRDVFSYPTILFTFDAGSTEDITLVLQGEMDSYTITGEGSGIEEVEYIVYD
ncbi:MAG: hypothetical protein PQJ35_03920 [Sphaerochaetaceae bacterium]|nr:hypothetical protein [Sphaerochaetaceae bacterium]